MIATTGEENIQPNFASLASWKLDSVVDNGYFVDRGRKAAKCIA